MKVILIGEENSRRTEYFRKAAEEQKVSVSFFSWDQWDIEDLEGGIVKIDPLSYDAYRLLELKGIIHRYKEQLWRLAVASTDVKAVSSASAALEKVNYLSSTEERNRIFSDNGTNGGKEIRFLNHPVGILKALDKAASKKMLQDRGLPVTEMLGENPRDLSELRQMMTKHRAWSVFIKPVYGSGAAGVLALSMQPSRGNMVAYTSACEAEGELVQQKKIRRITDEEEISRILHSILELDTIVERWHPKAMSGGEMFDFRVVWQFGKMEYLVARKSSMPITNLHLNNHVAMPEEIFTSEFPWKREQVLAEIEDLCRRAMQSFPELSMAGLDIMLDKKTGKPRIIEINGQGDLLYADIYGENCIYGTQIKYMAKGEGADWNGM